MYQVIHICNWGQSKPYFFLKRPVEKSINCWLVHSLDQIRMWLCGFETWREQARLLLDWLGLQGDSAAEAGRRRGREKMLEAAARRERQAQTVAFLHGRGARRLGFGRLDLLASDPWDMYSLRLIYARYEYARWTKRWNIRSIWVAKLSFWKLERGLRLCWCDPGLWEWSAGRSSQGHWAEWGENGVGGRKEHVEEGVTLEEESAEPTTWACFHCYLLWSTSRSRYYLKEGWDIL